MLQAEPLATFVDDGVDCASDMQLGCPSWMHPVQPVRTVTCSGAYMRTFRVAVLCNTYEEIATTPLHASMRFTATTTTQHDAARSSSACSGPKR